MLPRKLVLLHRKTANPNCIFRSRFWSKVDESHVVTEKWDPHEPPRDCEEASNTISTTRSMPEPRSYYASLANLTKTREWEEADFYTRISQINPRVHAVLQRHWLDAGVAAAAARRRPTSTLVSTRSTAAWMPFFSVTSSRLRFDADDRSRRRQTLEQLVKDLALAARIQVLRNRGYALSGDEDDLSKELDKPADSEGARIVQDPAVGARRGSSGAALLCCEAS
ncbi:hypothetical protein CEK25_004614 [Fusarium fujikuroi]|nr:hypothetical protein CEK25_004614 [Fusarium fujikuroi]